MSDLSRWLLHGMVNLIPMVLSLTVHECAHAWAAYRLGDDTAARMGRLTLDPIVHIDLIGTILLPLLGVPFGWAKPVPTQPTNFTRRFSMRTSSALVAAAGPLSNLLLALLSSVILAVIFRTSPTFRLQSGLGIFLRAAITINVALAIFNAIPLPPLDGHWIIDSLVTARAAQRWEAFKVNYSRYVLFAVVLWGSWILAGPQAVVEGWMWRIIQAVASF
jgi:Zn-dependent protease